MHSIIIFASGKGSNARAIIDYFRKAGGAHVSLIVTNKADAGVLEIAQEERIPFIITDRKHFKEAMIVEQMKDYNPSLIVLAGFLWKIPEHIVAAFPNRIINIHPALLPNYGGKGMYGDFVHNAVLQAGETESGISIHYVNEVYDSGDIIVQARCKVLKTDTTATLAGRIHALEHFFYPRTIEFILTQL